MTESGVTDKERADLWNAKLKQDQLNQAIELVDDDIRRVQLIRKQFKTAVDRLKAELPDVESQLTTLTEQQRGNKYIVDALTEQAPEMRKEIKMLILHRAAEDRALRDLGARVKMIERDMPTVASSVKLLVVSRLKNENELKKIREKVPDLEVQMKRLIHCKNKTENIKAVQEALNKKRVEYTLEESERHLKEMAMIEDHAKKARQAFILANKQRYRDQARANKRRKVIRQKEIKRRKNVEDESKQKKMYLGVIAAIGGAFILLQ